MPLTGGPSAARPRAAPPPEPGLRPRAPRHRGLDGWPLGRTSLLVGLLDGRVHVRLNAIGLIARLDVDTEGVTEG